MGPEPTMLPYDGPSAPSRRKVPSTSAWISYSPQPGATARIACWWATTLTSTARRRSASSAGLFVARSFASTVSSDDIGTGPRRATSVANALPLVSESCRA